MARPAGKAGSVSSGCARSRRLAQPGRDDAGPGHCGAHPDGRARGFPGRLHLRCLHRRPRRPGLPVGQGQRENELRGGVGPGPGRVPFHHGPDRPPDPGVHQLRTAGLPARRVTPALGGWTHAILALLGVVGWAVWLVAGGRSLRDDLAAAWTFLSTRGHFALLPFAATYATAALILHLQGGPVPESPRLPLDRLGIIVLTTMLIGPLPVDRGIRLPAVLAPRDLVEPFPLRARPRPLQRDRRPADGPLHAAATRRSPRTGPRASRDTFDFGHGLNAGGAHAGDPIQRRRTACGSRRR